MSGVAGGRGRSARAQVLTTSAGMVLFQACNFIAGVLIANGLGPAGQGRFQLLVSTCVFLAMLIKLGLDEGISYLVPRRQVDAPQHVRPLIMYSMAVTTAIGLAVGGLLWRFAAALERWVFRLEGFAEDLRFAPAMLTALILMLMALAALRALGRSDLRAYLYYGGVGVGYLVFVAVLFNVGVLDVANAFVVRTASYLLGAVPGIVLLIRLVPAGKWIPDGEEAAALHAFGGWLIFVGMFEYIVTQPLIDLVIVGWLGGAAEAGVYSVAARLGSLIGLLPAAMTIVLAATFSRQHAKNESAAREVAFERASTLMAFASVGVAGVLFFAGEPALRVFGAAYVPGYPLMLAILSGYVVLGLAGVTAPMLLSSGRERVEFGLSSLAATVMVAGGIALGSVYGPVGVAWATGAAVAVLAAGRLIGCLALGLVQRIPWPRRVLIPAVAGGLAGWLASRLPWPGEYAADIAAAIAFAVVYATFARKGVRAALLKRAVGAAGDGS